MATTPTGVNIALTGDHVTTTLNGALAAAATTTTIGTGLDIPATDGILQIHYASEIAPGTDNGPETVKYATYTSGSGALSGLTRGADANTTDVAHENGAPVQAGISTLHLNNLTDIIENSVWSDWTPTWANLTIGTTLQYAKYQRIGKTIRFRLYVLFDGANITSGNPTFSLPVTAASDVPTGTGTGEPMGPVIYVDAGTEQYFGFVYTVSTTLAGFNVFNASTTYVSNSGLSATIPFTWANTDRLIIKGQYESA